MSNKGAKEFSVDADKRSFRTLLKGDFYRIPRYQREYSWTREEIQDYWDDLQAAASEGHFMGNFVAHGLQDTPLEIVDGQQRLTTTLILLTLIRDRFYEMGDVSRVEGIDQYIKSKDDDGVDKWRLDYTDTNSYITRTLYQIGQNKEDGLQPHTDGDKKIAAAANLLSGFIDDEILLREEIADEELGEGGGDEPETSIAESVLAELRDRALNANVVHIRLADRKAAFDIFETLNDRGKSLTSADLVKTLIVSILTQSSPVDTVVNKWDRISGQVSAAGVRDFEEFLRVHWNSLSWSDGDRIVIKRSLRKGVARFIEDGGSPSRSLSMVIPKHLSPAARQDDKKAKIDETRANVYLASLAHSTDVLRVVKEPYNNRLWLDFAESESYSFDYRSDKLEDIRRHLHFIELWGSAQAMPLILAIMRKYVPMVRYSDVVDPISTKLVKKFLKVIDVFEFRWSRARRGSTSGQRDLYRRAAYELDDAVNNEEYAAAFDSFLSRARQMIPSDAQVRDGIKAISYMGQDRKSAPVVRAILACVNGCWGQAGFGFDTQSLSIEHLKGQKDVAIRSNRNLWVGRLGNLMLLPAGVNSTLPEQAQDKVDQVELYVPNGDAVLVNYLSNGRWDAKSASARLANIADVALGEVWTLDGL